MKTKTITSGYGFILAIILLAPLFLPACGTLPDGRLWGEDVTLLPPFSRILSAAETAVLDPRTWAPAGGALIFAIDDWDHKVSKWAVEHHSIFSSRATASDMSDSLRDGLTIWSIVTAIATPGGEQAGEWIFSKLKGGAVEFSGFQLSKWTTIGLKNAVGRTRPDGTDDSSFPSGHATSAFSTSRLASLNLEVIEIPQTARTILSWTGTGAAAGVAWARVEAGKHYPSDVLAGAALANFITVFIYRSFMGLSEDDIPAISVAPSEDGIQARFYQSF